MDLIRKQYDEVNAVHTAGDLQLMRRYVYVCVCMYDVNEVLTTGDMQLMRRCMYVCMNVCMYVCRM